MQHARVAVVAGEKRGQKIGPRRLRVKIPLGFHAESGDVERLPRCSLVSQIAAACLYSLRGRVNPGINRLPFASRLGHFPSFLP